MKKHRHIYLEKNISTNDGNGPIISIFVLSIFILFCSLIKKESETQRRSPTSILFEEWGTSGRKRPTVKDLLEILIKIESYRAADYVAVNILNESPPKRPQTGPAALVDVTLPDNVLDLRQIESILGNITYPKSTELAIASMNELINNNKDYVVDINVDRIKLEGVKQTAEVDGKSDLMIFSKTNELINFSTGNLLKDTPNTRQANDNVSSLLPDLSSLENPYITESDDRNIPDLSAVLKTTSNYNKEDTCSSSSLPDISKLQINSSFTNEEQPITEESYLDPNQSQIDQDNHSENMQSENIPNITLLQNL